MSSFDADYFTAEQRQLYEQSYRQLGIQAQRRYPNTVADIVDERSPYKGNGIMCFLPPEECRSLLEEAGFKQVRIERIGRTYHNGEIYFEFLSVEAAKP